MKTLICHTCYDLETGNSYIEVNNKTGFKIGKRYFIFTDLVSCTGICIEVCDLCVVIDHAILIDQSGMKKSEELDRTQIFFKSIIMAVEKNDSDKPDKEEK